MCSIAPIRRAMPAAPIAVVTSTIVHEFADRQEALPRLRVESRAWASRLRTFSASGECRMMYTTIRRTDMMTASGSLWEMADTLDGLVCLAWSTFIGEDLTRVDKQASVEDVVCSSIAISGPSNATVMFFADAAVARSRASLVLGMAPDELDDADIHDVFGEIVNIIGGNLKGVVSDEAGDWRLSLPVVSNAMQHAPGGRLVTDVSFVTDGGTVGCHILEHS
jgi:chemotaxis protein CheX